MWLKSRDCDPTLPRPFEQTISFPAHSNSVQRSLHDNTERSSFLGAYLDTDMDQMSAVGPASAIVQFVDFSTKLVHAANGIYQSASGATA